MPRFIIDANLPYHFSVWNTQDFLHLKDINDSLPDEEVWEYARKNDLIIVTKDSDFSHRILFNEPPPKVIHIRFGNMRMNKFHETVTRLWDDILKAIEKYKLVNVYADRIEGIN